MSPDRNRSGLNWPKSHRCHGVVGMFHTSNLLANQCPLGVRSGSPPEVDPNKAGPVLAGSASLFSDQPTERSALNLSSADKIAETACTLSFPEISIPCFSMSGSRARVCRGVPSANIMLTAPAIMLFSVTPLLSSLIVIRARSAKAGSGCWVWAVSGTEGAVPASSPYICTKSRKRACFSFRRAICRSMTASSALAFESMMSMGRV